MMPSLVVILKRKCTNIANKNHHSDSDSDSEDEVRDDLPFWRQEDERLGLFLDNRDDTLREAKKMSKELRASLEDAKTRVAELETQNLNAKLENDALKASPVIFDEVDCVDCSVNLADLTILKDKHDSTCDELDVLRVEVAELKSKPALLGACTSCLVLHGKFDEMHAYIVSLEAKLKEHVPTSCSTCEVHALKNLEHAHYVNRLQDENDDLRKMMGWLSGHEPQLRMMMETYKRQDGQALGLEKVGETSGEGGEKIGDILAPPI
jgi:regulator of replication initiation timing